MIPQIIIALAIAAASFGAAWKTQDWRYGAKETARVQAQLSQERTDNLRQIRREESVIAAINAGNQRAAALRRDAGAARSELEWLRGDLATDNQPSATLQACDQRKATLSDVFEQCASRYSVLAEKADGHANDVQTLTDSWPK